jgi:hypothetical protein
MAAVSTAAKVAATAVAVAVAAIAAIVAVAAAVAAAAKRTVATSIAANFSLIDVCPHQCLSFHHCHLPQPLPLVFPTVPAAATAAPVASAATTASFCLHHLCLSCLTQ